MKNEQLLLLPISSLKRVGPTLTSFLTKLVGQNKIFDLLLHKPIRAEKILFCPKLFETPNDSLIILKAKVESHAKPAKSRQPYKVICYTPSGYVNLVFFKIFPSQIAKMPIGSEIAILGYLQKLSGENQITHPQEILPASQIENLPKINVIYPLGAAISQKFLSQKIHEVLEKLVDKDEEWIDANLVKQQGWLSFGAALKKIHNPQSESDFLPENSARKRLAYDELLSWQIAVLLAKTQLEKTKNLTESNANLAEEFLNSLPFEPTGAQKKAIQEILSEINSTKKMLRLLQGDVGSGKTVVAIAACLQAISQGNQTCVMAPTTVLAKQHFGYFSKLLEKSKIRIELLTSATTSKQKAKILSNLFSGEIDILISTHAVLEDDVKFSDLGLTVIDEQHRFGVMQRLKMVEKGKDVDVLLMSATPIPRSLMMGLYGDMDISILNEKPKNRQEIETLVMSEKKIEEIYQAVKRAASRGEKIYWICPAIEPSTDLEIEAEQTMSNVKEKFAELSKIFGEKSVALLHGKMKESEKDKVMKDFANPSGELRLLVATTVIEVGIDVPEATVILIENAENFGLSQLHQLRGRVGRSDKKSFCILLYGKKFGENQRHRLNILRQSNDGFFIAEEDLKIRGSGELLGTKQSGFPEFKIANLMLDSDLLKIANKQARLIFNDDPKLKNPIYQKLLHLFGYENCLKIVEAG
jgi:ATP-dependent DNA helicase RecG